MPAESARTTSVSPDSSPRSRQSRWPSGSSAASEKPLGPTGVGAGSSPCEQPASTRQATIAAAMRVVGRRTGTLLPMSPPMLAAGTPGSGRCVDALLRREEALGDDPLDGVGAQLHHEVDL